MYKPKIYTSSVIISPPGQNDADAKGNNAKKEIQSAKGLIGFQAAPSALVAESPAPLRTVFVSQTWTAPIDSNTQFASIPLALAKIGLLTSNTPLAAEPWTIVVYPGNYPDPINMLSNVSIVGIDRNSVILGAEATLAWVCGTGGLNAGNTANREVIGLSNFTTLGDITITRTTKTGGTTLTTLENIIMSSGLKTVGIYGRTAVVPPTDDRTEFNKCKLDGASFVTQRCGFVKKTDTRCKFTAISIGTFALPGESLYFAKDCQDYGGTRSFTATSAWYFHSITLASRYNAKYVSDADLSKSVICFDSCLFDIATVSMQINGDNPLSKYYVRRCTIQQGQFGGASPCDRDRYEFPMQNIAPGPTGTQLNFNHPFVSNDYFVTMTAGELTHTCPTAVAKTTGYVTVASNTTTQPWAVCVTLNDAVPTPVPPC
jgi:hypothetical protein